MNPGTLAALVAENPELGQTAEYEIVGYEPVTPEEIAEFDRRLGLTMVGTVEQVDEAFNTSLPGRWITLRDGRHIFITTPGGLQQVDPDQSGLAGFMEPEPELTQADKVKAIPKPKKDPHKTRKKDQKDVDPVLTKVMTEEELDRHLQYHEANYRKSPVEVLFCFDDCGNMDAQQFGDPDHVAISPTTRAAMLAKPGKIMVTHNHPGDAPGWTWRKGSGVGKGLSPGDLAVAARYEVAGIRALHDDGDFFEMKPGKNGWPGAFQIQQTYANESARFLSDWEAKRKSGYFKPGTDEAIMYLKENYGPTINETIAKKYGLTYRRVKR